MNYKFVKISPPFDIEVNFWKSNPQLKYVTPFSKLYDRDKSKSHIKSSKEMWCIWLFTDVDYENKIIRLEIDQRKSAIQSYCPNFDFENELIKECMDAYPETCMTSAARSFKIEEESLVKRAAFINNSEYSHPTPVMDKYGKQVFAAGRPVFHPGTAKDLDQMRKLTLDIMKRYDQVRKMFEKEQQGETRVYGGGSETLMEEGGLMEINDK